MSVWRDVVGQEPALAILQRAVAHPDAMTHAWLFTGPPGSGRSMAARAFAGALLCPTGGCGSCRECRTAVDGTHADVDIVATEGLSIKVDQARELVQLAARRPSVGRWRMIIIEDADRLTDHSGNGLLKAIEEPGTRTIWVLCAPSVEDVLITVRSRSRQVRLRTPPIDAVAALLVEFDGLDPAMAQYAARAAQSHVGLARRLARDEGARIRRRQVVTMPTRIRGVGDAVGAAADLMAIADEEKEGALAERSASERERLLATLGADPAARTQPPTRLTRDVIDRTLTDLLSVYRDALVVATRAPVAVVNEDTMDTLTGLARAFSPVGLLQAMEAIGVARERIAANVPPLLALEAMAVSLRLPR